MYQGTTPKREYPVTMVRVVDVEEKGDESAMGGERRRIPDPGIVPELTVGLYAPPVRKELNEPHFEAIYAENQHCDTRDDTRVRGERGETGSRDGGCLSNSSGGCAVLTRPGLAADIDKLPGGESRRKTSPAAVIIKIAKNRNRSI